MLLNVLVILGVAYLLYTWGVRLQLRAQLTGKRWLEACGYALLLAAGTTAALFATLQGAAVLELEASVYELSAVSTVLSILCGEYLQARCARLSVRMFAPLRAKKQER